jgi:hypothetical protein
MRSGISRARDTSIWRVVMCGLLLSNAAIFLPIRACIALGSDKNHPPTITGEQAVIIWDEAHKIEHFIRQADISTKEPNLGFIVPTPQTPELVEADPLLFRMALEEAAPKMVPEIIEETPLQFIHRILGSWDESNVFSTISENLAVAEPATNGVQVISEQDVADYHATILSADNVTSLGQWLKDNGYAWNKDDEAWLKLYVENKWKITAFKLLKKPSEQGTDSIKTHAIRMSFAADHPFFPYSEPGDTAEGQNKGSGSRSLSVAILSNQRMGGVLADGHAWPGKLLFSGPMEAPYVPSQFLAFAKLDDPKLAIAVPICLTYFLDESDPRPGTADLNFSPSADQSPIQRIEINYDLPKDYRIDWSHPLSDAGAFAIVLLILTPLIWIISFVWRKPKET